MSFNQLTVPRLIRLRSLLLQYAQLPSLALQPLLISFLSPPSPSSSRPVPAFAYPVPRDGHSSSPATLLAALVMSYASASAPPALPSTSVATLAVTYASESSSPA